MSSSGVLPSVAAARSAETSTPRGLPAVPAIAVPAPIRVAPPAPAPQSVTVGSGDTLDSLARRHGQTWRELWSRNLSAVSNPNILRVGQTLSLVADRAPLPVLPPPPAPVRTAPSTAGSAPAVVPAAPTSTSSVSEAPGLSDVVSVARTFTGIPYRWGGKSRSGVDCSGLVYLVFKQAGLTDTYRTSSSLRDWVRQIPRAEARPGDLVFGPGHVGIYIGNGRMIDAPRTGTVVQERSVYSSMYFYGRVPA